MNHTWFMPKKGSYWPVISLASCGEIIVLFNLYPTSGSYLECPWASVRPTAPPTDVLPLFLDMDKQQHDKNNYKNLKSNQFNKHFENVYPTGFMARASTERWQLEFHQLSTGDGLGCWEINGIPGASHGIRWHPGPLASSARSPHQPLRFSENRHRFTHSK